MTQEKMSRQRPENQKGPRLIRPATPSIPTSNLDRRTGFLKPFGPRKLERSSIDQVVKKQRAVAILANDNFFAPISAIERFRIGF